MSPTRPGPGIYLDHAATSPIRVEVWEAMASAVGTADFNAASQHAFGRAARVRLEDAREELASALGATRHEIVLTGGGTQSDNLAILGFARARMPERPRLLVSRIEHKAVLEPAERAGSEGAEVVPLDVDRNGELELQALERELEASAGRPTLVSVMWANNEIGVVQPLDRITELAHRHGASIHTDAVQAVGKLDVSVRNVPVDLLTMTAHKLGGPVGVGLLYVRRGAKLEPLAYGGGQEGSLWPGTQNPVGAVGLAAAVRLATGEPEAVRSRWSAMRDRLELRLREGIPDLRVHAGAAETRMPNLLSVGIPGVDQAALLVAVDLAGVAVSGGSACSSGSARPSHVLEAIGVHPEEGGYGVLRFSFGPQTTPEEVERAATVVLAVVERLRESGAGAGGGS
ncbi:MAG: cysteine desulfurase family protein [Gemmatimonadota bacterium]